jgi:hypothetical protein
MTVTGKVRKVEMREQAFEILGLDSRDQSWGSRRADPDDRP